MNASSQEVATAPGPLELSGTPTEEDRQRAEKVMLPMPFLFTKWPMWCVLFVLVLIEFAIDGLLPLSTGMIVAPAILMAILWALGARMIRQRVMFPLQDATFRIGEDLLEIEDERVSRQLRWSAFREVAHDDEVLLLFETMHVYVLISRSWLPGEVLWEDFVKFIDSRMKAKPSEQLEIESEPREGRILIQGPIAKHELVRLHRVGGTWIAPAMMFAAGIVLMLPWWGIYGFWVDWQTRLFLLVPVFLLPTCVGWLLWWRALSYLSERRQFLTETPVAGWLSFEEITSHRRDDQTCWQWSIVTKAYEVEDAGIILVCDEQLPLLLAPSQFRPGQWSSVVSLVRSKVTLETMP